MDKILYVDVETTGLKPDFHDIIELAYIIEVGGVVKDKNCLKIQPFSYENVDMEAIEVSGNTIEQIKTFTEPRLAYRKFVDALGKHCNKFDKNDKFTPAGFNCRFDLDFLNQFFIKNGDKYFGSWQTWKGLDPLPILHFLNFSGKIDMPKYTLEESCKFFGIEIKAHSAESDIDATRNLLLKLVDIFKTVPKLETVIETNCINGL
jgi:DNA polymerase-3 subunit epsilon